MVFAQTSNGLGDVFGRMVNCQVLLTGRDAPAGCQLRTFIAQLKVTYHLFHRKFLLQSSELPVNELEEFQDLQLLIIFCFP